MFSPEQAFLMVSLFALSLVGPGVSLGLSIVLLLRGAVKGDMVRLVIGLVLGALGTVGFVWLYSQGNTIFLLFNAGLAGMLFIQRVFRYLLYG